MGSEVPHGSLVGPSCTLLFGAGVGVGVDKKRDGQSAAGDYFGALSFERLRAAVAVRVEAADPPLHQRLADQSRQKWEVNASAPLVFTRGAELHRGRLP
jgi:hypothetical protein